LKSKPGLFAVVADSFRPYKNPEKLIAGLKSADFRAIAWVLEQTDYPVKQFLRLYGLDADMHRDFQHDGVIILIEKIKSNEYDANVSSPATYLVGICKYLILNRLRAKKELQYSALDTDFEWSDPDEILYASAKEMSELLDDLLEKLGAPCNELIRLKYLEGYKDEEVLKNKMTHYTSGESLRNTRSQCMKKLTDMARRMNANL
jgi:RNA polymerase sigma factor (sigma-70 family)